MVRFLAEMIPGGHRLRQREGTADCFYPIAHVGRIGIAQLDGRQRRVGIDLDHGQVGGLIDADHPRRAPEILVVGIGRELDVDLVGLIDHVIVGDDVALGIDDEAGAQRLANTAAAPLVAVIACHRAPAAEEAVEEVLEVALPPSSPPPAAAGLHHRDSAGFCGLGWTRPWKLRRAFIGRLLGQRLGIDVDHRRPHGLGDLHEFIGLNRRIHHLQGRGVGAVVLLLLTANSVRNIRAGHDADRERSKKNEHRSETARA